MQNRDTSASALAHDIRNAPPGTFAWLAVAAAPVLVVLGFTVLLKLPATRDIALQQLHGDREQHAVEIATFWLALLAGPVGAWLCIQRDLTALERGFFAFFAVGMVLIAMEEGAWGQVLFPYQTPEWMADVNRQGDMTLHNIGPLQGRSEVFRLVFGVGGLIGLLAPMRWVDTVRVPRSLASALVVITVYAVFDTLGDYGLLPRRVDRYFAQTAEVIELLIAYTGLAYLALHLACRRPVWRAGTRRSG